MNHMMSRLLTSVASTFVGRKHSQTISLGFRDETEGNVCRKRECALGLNIGAKQYH